MPVGLNARNVLATQIRVTAVALNKSTAKAKRNSRGRPAVYQQDYPKRVRRLALIGLCDAEIAAALGVSQPSLLRWKEKYPEFSKSLTDARQASGGAAVALFKRAVGFTKRTEKLFCSEGQIIRGDTKTYYPPDVTACLQILKRTHPQIWGDAGSGSAPTRPTQNVSDIGAGMTIVIDAGTLAMCGVAADASAAS